MDWDVRNSRSGYKNAIMTFFTKYGPAPCDKNCRSDHQTLFPLFGEGLGTRLNQHMYFGVGDIAPPSPPWHAYCKYSQSSSHSCVCLPPVLQPLLSCHTLWDRWPLPLFWVWNPRSGMLQVHLPPTLGTVHLCRDHLYRRSYQHASNSGHYETVANMLYLATHVHTRY